MKRHIRYPNIVFDELKKSGISDTESESGNASDRGYTSDRDDQPTEILSLVRFFI